MPAPKANASAKAIPPWEQDAREGDKKDVKAEVELMPVAKLDEDEADEDDAKAADVHVHMGSGDVHVAQSADADDDDDAEKADSDDDTTDKKKDDMEQKARPVTEESLCRALAAVKHFYKAHDQGSRKDALLAKAQSGQLSEQECRELYTTLGGQGPKKESLRRSVKRSFEQSESLQKGVQKAQSEADVGAYLQALSGQIAKSMGTLADATEAASTRQHAVNLIVCKALSQVGGAVAAIGKRMQVIESQPARAPKSLSARPVSKSFAGAPEGAQGLDPHVLTETLTEMNRRSWAEGRNGRSPGGLSILDGISTLSVNNALDKALLQEAIDFRKSQRKGA